MIRMAGLWLLLAACSTDPLHPVGDDAGVDPLGHCYLDAFKPCIPTDFGPCTSTYRGWVTTSDGTRCSACPDCDGTEPPPIQCCTNAECGTDEYCLYICVPLSASTQ